MAEYTDRVGNSSARQDAVVVLSKLQTQENAQSSCAAIGENLWMPNTVGNVSDHVDFLRYLGYSSLKNESQLYWIGGGSNSTCNTITPEGTVQSTDCRKRLPTLCSQSAPLSFPDASDTASKWQTTVTTGNQMITG